MARTCEVAAPLQLYTQDKSIPFVWSLEVEAAFTMLKGSLIDAPVLAYPDTVAFFILDTDTSNTENGAVNIVTWINGKEGFLLPTLQLTTL